VSLGVGFDASSNAVLTRPLHNRMHVGVHAHTQEVPGLVHGALPLHTALPGCMEACERRLRCLHIQATTWNAALTLDGWAVLPTRQCQLTSTDRPPTTNAAQASNVNASTVAAGQRGSPCEGPRRQQQQRQATQANHILKGAQQASCGLRVGPRAALHHLMSSHKGQHGLAGLPMCMRHGPYHPNSPTGLDLHVPPWLVPEAGRNQETPPLQCTGCNLDLTPPAAQHLLHR
jgi:hypothetical protein